MRVASPLLLFIALSLNASADTEGRPSMIDSSPKGENRPAVADNTDEIEIKDMISSLEDSFNAENVEGYSRCFKGSSRKAVRRKTAVLFASGNCSIDVQESHIIEISEDKAEIAVRYVLGAQGRRSDIVSTVKFLKEDGLWLINSESLISKTASGKSSGAASRGQVAEWDPYKPDPTQVSNGLQHLIGDIGVRPGMGCADGRCANGRCER